MGKRSRWRDAGTGRFTTRPADLSELFHNGRMYQNDIDPRANQGQLSNQWLNTLRRTDLDGFRYVGGPMKCTVMGPTPGHQADHTRAVTQRQQSWIAQLILARRSTASIARGGHPGQIKPVRVFYLIITPSSGGGVRSRRTS